METNLIKAIGTEGATSPIHEITIKRRVVQPHDVQMEILYCGICFLLFSYCHSFLSYFNSYLYFPATKRVCTNSYKL